MSDHEDLRSFGLGRNLSTFDPKDWNLRLFALRRTDITERLWGFNHEALDQKDKPHCGGFSMAHFGLCLPTFSDYTNEDGDEFYKQCKITDLQPGWENGTSVRSIAVTGQKLKMWPNYAFATDVETIYAWLLNSGPVIMGTNWYTDMFMPNGNHVIHPTGDLAGGHAWVAIGVNLNSGYIDGLTSWGPSFGDNGRFRIPMIEFRKLFAQQGEAIAAIETGKIDPSGIVEENPGCLSALKKVWGK